MTAKDEIKDELDLLPSCTMYGKYIQIAMIRFGMTSDQVRNKYGLYSTRQWNEMLSADSDAREQEKK